MRIALGFLAAGMAMIGYGIFGWDRSGTTTRTAFWIGYPLTWLAFALLVRAGWRGSWLGWFFAAVPAVVLTWVTYELVRQGPGYPDIGFLDEMTAPVLSLGAAVVVIGTGFLRLGWLRMSSPSED